MTNRKHLWFTIVLLFITLFSGCTTNRRTAAGDDGQIIVYTSFYTMYDFTSKIGGSKVKIVNMVPSGTEPHDWEPSPRDIAGLSGADLFIYNGAGMEGWAEKVLESIHNDDLTVVESSRGVRLEKPTHGKTVNDGHDDSGIDLPDVNPGYDEKENSHSDVEEEHHEEENSVSNVGNGDNHKENSPQDTDSEGQKDGHGHSHEDLEYDPHVWLNPMNAKKQMEAIRDGLIQVDPQNSQFYQDNFQMYSKKLDTLDKAYHTAVTAFLKKEIVVSHEAFGYLCSAYGLKQLAIEGISSESEPTPARMAEIIDFVREHDVRVIFFEELASPKVAEAIAKETGVATALLNPLEGLSEENLQAGKEYFSVMEDNLEALKQALQ